MKVVLDACALIAFLRNEPGADVVYTYLNQHPNTCYIHALNLCEVYYDFVRSDSLEQADHMLQIVNQDIELHICTDLDEAFIRAVGKIKGTIKKISLADCCAAILSQRLEGYLLTSDHHEFESLANQKICKIVFIR